MLQLRGEVLEFFVRELAQQVVLMWSVTVRGAGHE